MFDRLRHKYGFQADQPDSTVLRHVRNLKFPDGVDDDVFAQGVADFENEGAASADSTPRSNGETSPVGAAVGAGMDLAKAGFSEMGQAGKAFLNAPIDLAKSFINIPRGLVADPLSQVFQNRKATPEEEARSQSGLGGLLGLSAMGPVGKFASKIGLSPRLASAAGWGAGGALDTAISSGGDPRQTAAGAGVSALMGAVTHGAGRAAMGEGGSPLLARKAPGARLAAELAPVGTRLKSYGEPGKAIHGMLDAAIQEGEQAGGPPVRAFKEAGGSSLTPGEDALLLAALEGKRNITRETLPPKLQAAFDVAESHRTQMPLMAHQAGVQVRMKGGETKDFSPQGIPDYFPRKQLSPKELITPGAQQDAVAKHLVADFGFKDEASARLAMRNKARFIDSGGREGGEELGKALIESGVARNENEAQGMLLRMTKAPSRKIESSLEYARQTKDPFYDARPSAVLPEHFASTGKAMAEIVNMGQRLEKVSAEIRKIPDRADRETVRRLVRVVVGAVREGDSTSGGIRQFNIRMFTPLTTLKNLTQGPTNIPLTSDVGDLVKGYAKAFTKAGEKRAETSGAIGEGVRENIAHAMGKPKGLAAQYLNAIGFTPVERYANRKPAALVGEQTAMHYGGRLKSNPADAFARSELKRLNLDPEQVARSGVTERGLDLASLKHSHRSQFRLSPLDVPAFANEHELGRNIFQFKGFDYEQTRLVYEETVGRMRTGNPTDFRRGIRNLAILATVYPAFGEVVQDAMSVVTGVKRPTNLAQRYGEDFLTSAAPGTLGSLIQAIKYGRGDRGGNLAKWAAGPTVGSVVEGVQLATDVAGRQGKTNQQTHRPLPPMTPSQQRSALRLLLGGPGAIVSHRLFPSGASDEKHEKKAKAAK